MDMITLALAKPKHINLDDYGITDVLLGLFQQGGGSFTAKDDRTFWDEVNTDRPLKLSFTFTPINRVTVSGVTTVSNESGKFNAQVSFECVIKHGDVFYRVAAMLENMNASEETTIAVKVANI